MNNQANNNNNSDDLHYRFTAYVNKALDNARMKYMGHTRQDQKVMSLDEMIEAGVDLSSGVDVDTTAFLCDLEQLIENDSLCLAILELTGKERQILSLHFIYKVPFTEIAELLGISYETVYKRYSRSLKKIGKKMEGENKDE